MARFDRGYVKLWRKTLDTDLDSNAILWWIWTWLVRAAIWQETKVIWEGQQRVLPPGSVVYGVRELAAKGVASRSTISRWIKYLNDTGRIRNEVGTHGCIATLLNWETYSGLNDDAGTDPVSDVDTDRTRTGHGPALNEEVKKERIHKHTKKTPKIQYSKDFEEFWTLYPGAGSKQLAAAKFEAIVAASPDAHARLLTTLRSYIRFCKRTDRTHQNAETFLNNWEGWEQKLPQLLGSQAAKLVPKDVSQI